MTFLGTVKGGVIVPKEPVELPEGAEVRVEFMGTTDAITDAGPSLLERLRPVVGVIDDLPADSSVNIDHYLYGHPTR